MDGTAVLLEAAAPTHLATHIRGAYHKQQQLKFDKLALHAHVLQGHKCVTSQHNGVHDRILITVLSRAHFRND
jgi:hypothetical protein